MAPLASSLIAVAVLFAAVPGGLAGPACTHRAWSSVDECVAQCSSKWGWPGHAFGADPWGQVVNTGGPSTDAKSVVADACSAQVSGTAAASSSAALSTAP
jgi:hypothetical protein